MSFHDYDLGVQETMSADCLFCKMVAGDIPVKKVLETNTALAFHDISPQAPLHVLVIPKVHTENVASTDNPQIFADVLVALRQVAQQENVTDYRVVMNNGEKAGQSVFHLHAHLLAGRPFAWPPG